MLLDLGKMARRPVPTSAVEKDAVVLGAPPMADAAAKEALGRRAPDRSSHGPE
jgi:hypothetical protein